MDHSRQGMGDTADNVLSPTTATGLHAHSTAAFSGDGASAVLVGISGPGAGLTLAVGDQPVTIGSAHGCDLVVTDPQVSRRHLELSWQRNRIRATDLGSKNGSFFAGERFDAVELAYGDTVRIGRTAFKALPDERAIEPAPARTETFGGMVGRSRVMRQLFTLIEQVASSEVSVLIEGETGVGKELVAEELHRRSPRRDRPFIVFDCGAVPGELIESALFGHVKGAFTGATSDRSGVFAEADGGTVFLDEIGELRIDLQPALLRVLDRGMVRRVGESRFRNVDVRVIAATHRNLGERIVSGEFREDLYYRLAVVRLSVPALRERPQDIELLCRHFLRSMGRPAMGVDDATLAELQARPWPGNVRELRNVIARGVALSTGTELSFAAPEGLAPAALDRSGPVAASSFVIDGERRSFRDAKADAIEAFERAYLTELMAEHDNLTAAANAAAMDRKHLRVLLRRYQLDD